MNQPPVIAPQGYGRCDRCGRHDTVHGPSTDLPCYCQGCLDRAERHLEMFAIAIKAAMVLTVAAGLLKIAVERMH